MTSLPALVRMVSAPAPPMTMASPPPRSTLSAPPMLPEVMAWVSTPAWLNTSVPVSANTMMRPPSVVMRSAPRPPMTVAMPSSRLMLSSPPATPMAAACRMVPAAAKLTVALSPKTAVLPVPSVMLSAPKPPRMRLSPSSPSMLSLPPRFGESETREAITPAAVQLAWPASPISVSLPAPAVIWSPPAPPMTILAPLPTAITSPSPSSGLTESAESSTPAAFQVNCALSPATLSWPAPVVMASVPAPPMTRLRPFPASMLSAAP